MSDTATPQPAPQPGGAKILDLVVGDLRERAEMGRAKYGTYLQAGNGREALVDAYQEALDLAMYLRQEITEARTRRPHDACEHSDCDRQRRELQAALTAGVEERRVLTARSLARLQEEQREWSVRNFPAQESWECLVGATEEIGELAHAHLKMHQGIRTTEDHEAAGRDAVGDVVVFLAGYCSARGWSLEDCVVQAWDTVKRRDWQAAPEHGGER